MNPTKSWNHQKPSNTWLITQPEEHRDLLPQLVERPTTAVTGKRKSANEITPNVMNIHDVIIIVDLYVLVHRLPPTCTKTYFVL